MTTPNAKTRAAIAESRKMSTVKVVNSLGAAQTTLEATTKEMRAAQAAYERASERLQLAEEQHQLAMTALASEVNTVKDSAKVVPTLLK